MNTILYIGPLNVGGTCLQRLWAFKALGFRVIPIDTYNYGLLNQIYRIGRRLSAYIDLNSINKNILHFTSEFMPEIVWIDKGLVVDSVTLQEVKRVNPKTIIVSYSPDDMMNPENQSHQYLTCIPFYDIHVTTKSYNIEELKGLGAHSVVFVSNAFCSYSHKPITIDAEEKNKFGGKVGFIGSFELQRAQSLLFLAENGINLKVWGNWPKHWIKILSSSSVIITGRELIGIDYAKAINSFDINLNFLRKVNRDVQTTRSLEIAACGGFMLAERTLEHQELFAEGAEAEYFGNNEELLEKVIYFLLNHEKRLKISQAGRQRCLDSNYSNESMLMTVIHHLGIKI